MLDEDQVYKAIIDIEETMRKHVANRIDQCALAFSFMDIFCWGALQTDINLKKGFVTSLEQLLEKVKGFEENEND